MNRNVIVGYVRGRKARGKLQRDFLSARKRRIKESHVNENVSVCRLVFQGVKPRQSATRQINRRDDAPPGDVTIAYRGNSNSKR